MNIVVCDANILIDLLQIDLFNAFLKLKWEKHVPPDVVDEVQETNSDQLDRAIQSREIHLPVFSGYLSSSLQQRALLHIRRMLV
jgi:hypothetical protein